MSGSRRSRAISLHSSKSLMKSDDEEEVQQPAIRAVEEGAAGNNMVQENVGDEAGDENMGESRANENVQHNQSAARSVMSSRQNRVEHIVPESEYLNLLENNCALKCDPMNFRKEHRIIIELLKHHPFKKWFTLKKSVPVQYIQQWWKHLRLVNNQFESEIGGVTVAITIEFMREMLRLPEKDDLLRKEDFDDTPTSEIMIADFIRLGYNDELTTLSHFKRNKLPPIWAFFFNTINKCLSGKNSSIDQGSKQILQIFHGFVKNKHYDYAAILWEDMKYTFEKNQGFIQKGRINKALKYIPYLRYWQMVIWHAMDQDRNIPRRSNEEHGPIFYMGKMVSNFTLTNFPNHILLPRSLRNYIKKESEILREYLDSVGFGQPQIPAQENQPERSGEGSIQEREGENVQGEEHSERPERKNSESLVSKGKEKQNESGEEERLLTEIETERDVSEPAVRIRAPTSATGSQLLVTGIEKDTTEPMVHIDKPQSSHSPAIKQAVVSFQTGEPSQTHLERGDKSHPIFQHFESEWHSNIQFEPNNPFHTRTSQEFRIPVKTSIDIPFVGTQGLDGSPGGVNISKAPLHSTSVVHGVSETPTGQEFSEPLKTGPSVGTGSLLELSEFEKIQKQNKVLGDKVEKLESTVELLKKEVKDLKSILGRKENSVETKIDNLKGEIKEHVTECQKDLVKTMNEMKTSLLQALSIKLASVSQPLAIMPMSVAEPEATSTQSKRKFDEDEFHNHQKGEKRQKLDTELEEQSKEQSSELEKSTDIGIADFEMADMELAEEVIEKTVEIQVEKEVSSDKTEEMKIDETEVNSGATEVLDLEEEVMSEQSIMEIERSEVFDTSEVVMSERSEVNSCRDIVLYRRRELLDSELEERRRNDILIRRMNSELIRTLNSQNVHKSLKLIRPVDLMGKEDCTVKYSESFRHEFVENFIDELGNSEEFDKTEDFFMPPEFMFREPITIPKINLPILEEPVCDYILEMSDTPLARHFHNDIFPEETYVHLYHTEGEYVMLESNIDGFMDEPLQITYSEASNKFRVPDSKLYIQRKIEKISAFQIEEFDGLKFMKLEVLKEKSVKVCLTSFDFHRLSLEDQIFLVKFFASTEEAWMEIECRRLLGIYVRNMYLYDFQLAIEGRKEKCNLSCPRKDAGNILLTGFTSEGMESEGYVYSNHRECLLFRLKEMVKYSNATLSWLLEEMEHETERKVLKKRCIEAVKRRMNLRDKVKNCGEWLLSEVNLKKVLHSDFVFPAEYEVNEILSDEVEDDIPEDAQMKDSEQSEPSEAVEEEMPIDLNGYFLEYALPNFFQPAEVSFMSAYHDRTKIHQNLRIEMAKKFGKPKEAVYSDFLITSIREIKEKKFLKHEYYSFEVLREDGKVYYFTEADFQKMSVTDFHRLYSLLSNKDSSKYKAERGALAAVREAMFYILRWHAYIDFQIALHLQRPCVYLSKPNNNHEQLNVLKSGNVVSHPELGVFMRNDREEKIFFRSSEAAKYCSGTLRFIKHNLENKLKRGKQTEEIQEIIDQINRRLTLRNVLISKFIPALKECDDEKYKTI